MVNYEHHDGADHCNKHTVKVEPIHSFRAEKREEPPPHDRSHNPKHDIEDESFASIVHNFAGDKPCYQTQDDPTNDRHADLQEAKNLTYKRSTCLSVPPESKQ